MDKDLELEANNELWLDSTNKKAVDLIFNIAAGGVVVCNGIAVGGSIL